MSLRFVSKSVLTSSDGVSHNEEKPIAPQHSSSSTLIGGSLAPPLPLFEQLRNNAQQAQEQYDEMARSLRGTRLLDEDDVAHLTSVEQAKMEMELQIRREENEQLALFRKSRLLKHQQPLVEEQEQQEEEQVIYGNRQEYNERKRSLEDSHIDPSDWKNMTEEGPDAIDLDYDENNRENVRDHNETSIHSKLTTNIAQGPNRSKSMMPILIRKKKRTNDTCANNVTSIEQHRTTLKQQPHDKNNKDTDLKSTTITNGKETQLTQGQDRNMRPHVSTTTATTKITSSNVDTSLHPSKQNSIHGLISCYQSSSDDDDSDDERVM